MPLGNEDDISGPTAIDGAYTVICSSKYLPLLQLDMDPEDPKQSEASNRTKPK